MNKSELRDAIAKKSGLTKKDSGVALNAFIDVIEDALAKGKSVHLTGFVNIKVNHRSARKGHNPQTGKPLTISARNVASFKAGKGLKTAINK